MNKPRRRIAGRLDYGPRGMHVVTEAGDRWVVENQDIEPELIGRQVVAEGTVVGLDRLKVDWIGEAMG